MKRSKLVTIVVLLAIACGLMVGCSEGQASAKDISIDAASDPKSAWPEKLVIVQMPDETNPDAGSKHEGFRKAMEEFVGIKIEELEGSDYTVGIEAMKSGKLDIMLVTPMSYYQAKRVANVEPLVTTKALEAAPYKTVFVTKSGRDDINSLEDLKGKTFAFVDPASSSGYMYPKAHLVTQLGLDAEKLETPGFFFETVAYSGKHDTSLVGVTMGDYDAAAVAYQIISQIAAAGMIDEKDIKIIGETETIPNACFVMRSELPQDLKDKIKEFYLQFADEDYFTAFYKDPSVRYIEAKDSDYDVVKQMVEILKIEQ